MKMDWGHNASPVVSSSDDNTERRTPKGSGSAGKAKRQKRVAYDLSVSLPQLNMSLTDPTENDNISNSFLMKIVPSKL